MQTVKQAKASGVKITDGIFHSQNKIDVHKLQKEHEKNMKTRIQYDHINDLH